MAALHHFLPVRKMHATISHEFKTPLSPSLPSFCSFPLVPSRRLECQSTMVAGLNTIKCFHQQKYKWSKGSGGRPPTPTPSQLTNIQAYLLIPSQSIKQMVQAQGTGKDNSDFKVPFHELVYQPIYRHNKLKQGQEIINPNDRRADNKEQKLAGDMAPKMSKKEMAELLRKANKEKVTQIRESTDSLAPASRSLVKVTKKRPHDSLVPDSVQPPAKVQRGPNGGATDTELARQEKEKYKKKLAKFGELEEKMTKLKEDFDRVSEARDTLNKSNTLLLEQQKKIKVERDLLATQLQDEKDKCSEESARVEEYKIFSALQFKEGFDGALAQVKVIAPDLDTSELDFTKVVKDGKIMEEEEEDEELNHDKLEKEKEKSATAEVRNLSVTADDALEGVGGTVEVPTKDQGNALE